MGWLPRKPWIVGSSDIAIYSKVPDLILVFLRVAEKAMRVVESAHRTLYIHNLTTLNSTSPGQ